MKHTRLAQSPILKLALLLGLVTPSITLFNVPRSLAQDASYCWLPPQTVTQKEQLLVAGLKGDKTAQTQYQSLMTQHAQGLQNCRRQSWLKNQAIWLRVYECDLRPGVLDSILDRIVSRGYNQVYVEVFYSGQVLLPTSQNNTPWTSVVRSPQYANRDLLAEVIQKGQTRGVKVYAWMFAMNYGYQYGTRGDRQGAIGRNGYGQTSLNVASDGDPNIGDSGKAFADPYSPQAQQDYANMLQAVLSRRPDGVLFDYIRYPRQTGGASVASRSQDLWIYGPAARQAMVDRGLNQKGRVIIDSYLRQGSISAGDLASIDRSFPGESEPTWQGRSVPTTGPKPPLDIRLARLRWDLWLLSVAHAYQGIVDFLHRNAIQSQRQGVTAGAVFFPEANRRVGQGFDSRMQPWDQFSRNLEWHVMTYGLCSDGTSCITNQVKRVKEIAPGKSFSPVIAGAWGQPAYNRPSLETQMAAIRQVAPELTSISHFDFSWQDPLFANARRDCKVSFVPEQ
jgi:hypothetical protein